MLHCRARRRGPEASPAPAHRSRTRAAAVRALLAGAVTGAVLLGSAAPAGAVPAPPPNPTDSDLGQAQSAQDAAAAEVGRIAALVATAEGELERVGHQAEAAGVAYLLAEEALAAAQAEAERTA